MANVEQPQKVLEINANIACQILAIPIAININNRLFAHAINYIEVRIDNFLPPKRSIKLCWLTTIAIKLLQTQLLQFLFYLGSNSRYSFQSSLDICRSRSRARSFRWSLFPVSATKRQILKPGFPLLSGLQIEGHNTIIFLKSLFQ